jgi:hypothetical protein
MTKAGFIKSCSYATWISTIVPVKKKNGQLHVCIDFRDLNKAIPKNVYPMSSADMLIDVAVSVSHRMMSLLGDNVGYCQCLKYEYPRRYKKRLKYGYPRL